MQNTPVTKYRKLITHEDLNPAGNLFGGQMLKFLDEAAALYAMCQLRTNNLVTLKMSEILFTQPVKLGDVIEFSTYTAGIGKTSFTVGVNVYIVKFGEKVRKAPEVALTANIIFVTLDSEGKPVKHLLDPLSNMIGQR